MTSSVMTQVPLWHRRADTSPVRSSHPIASWAFLIEHRRVEFHDGVSNGLLFDSLVQGSELSPELHRIAVRACVHPCVLSRRRRFHRKSEELDISFECAIRN